MSKCIVFLAALALLAGPVAAADSVATVGNRTISRAELEKRIRPKLVEIESQRFEALSEGLDAMVEEELLAQEAKARGVSVDELQKTEIEAKVKAPTDAEARALYEEHKDEIQGTYEQVQSQLVEYMKRQQAVTVRQEYIDGLKKKYPVKIALEAPKVEVSAGGRAARGGKNAPVQIISWSDYECPFCKRAEPTVEQVLKEYGDKVSFVHRDFPLDFHQHAEKAAEAAHCAEAQNKFWEYHSKLFATQDLSEPSLKTIAKDLGLDTAKFDACLASGQYKAAIQKDVEDGAAAGVAGTPAFFINGRMLSGAQPYEKFKEVIDAELAKK
ncbi:MAG TPA: thioredoxin domain-containing protein [Terriglobales bacterium]|nr:thioredoxin domain-containing protein [Terriglobales bacterium]